MMEQKGVGRLARVIDDKVYIGGTEYPLSEVIKFDNFKGIVTDDAGNRYVVFGIEDIEGLSTEHNKLQMLTEKITELTEAYKSLSTSLVNLAQNMDFKNIMTSLFFGKPRVYNFTVHNSLNYYKLNGYARSLIIHNVGSSDLLITFSGSSQEAYTIPSGDVGGNPLSLDNIKYGEVNMLLMRSSGSSTQVEVIAVLWGD